MGSSGEVSPIFIAEIPGNCITIAVKCGSQIFREPTLVADLDRGVVVSVVVDRVAAAPGGFAFVAECTEQDEQVGYGHHGITVQITGTFKVLHARFTRTIVDVGEGIEVACGFIGATWELASAVIYRGLRIVIERSRIGTARLDAIAVVKLRFRLVVG